MKEVRYWCEGTWPSVEGWLEERVGSRGCSEGQDGQVSQYWWGEESRG